MARGGAAEGHRSDRSERSATAREHRLRALQLGLEVDLAAGLPRAHERERPRGAAIGRGEGENQVDHAQRRAVDAGQGLVGAGRVPVGDGCPGDADERRREIAAERRRPVGGHRRELVADAQERLRHRVHQGRRGGLAADAIDELREQLGLGAQRHADRSVGEARKSDDPDDGAEGVEDRNPVGLLSRIGGEPAGGAVDLRRRERRLRDRVRKG